MPDGDLLGPATESSSDLKITWRVLPRADDSHGQDARMLGLDTSPALAPVHPRSTETAMPLCTPVRILASAVAAACATAFAAPPSLAQAAPTLDIQVLEFDYAPSAAQQGLDLRPGRYLLQLQRDASGRFEGTLQGPRNERMAERIAFRASPGCAVGIPANAALSAEALPGKRGLNLLRIEIADATGGCTLEGLVPILGLTSINVTGNEPDCDPPEEIEQVGSLDTGPACAPPPPPPQLPIAAPNPDLKPGRHLQLAGRSFRWTDRIELTASQALATVAGRCVFSYAYAIENVGRADSEPTDSSLLIDSRLGLQLALRSLPRLAPGGFARVQGTIALPPGNWRIYAHVDASDRVGEWNGTNNARSVRVNVQGDCGVGL